jgi:hypothetical protein
MYIYSCYKKIIKIQHANQCEMSVNNYITPLKKIVCINNYLWCDKYRGQLRDGRKKEQKNCSGFQRKRGIKEE